MAKQAVPRLPLPVLVALPLPLLLQVPCMLVWPVCGAGQSVRRRAVRLREWGAA